MKRNTEHLKQKEFDIVIIGAGIHGACIARDAALRGLNVALIDKGDICSETSHNSLKIIHGGIRYLQHLNIKRTLESIQEQKIWLTTAPHLVKPMQCIMPTYGHGMRGPEVMWLGIKAYEFMGLGRNKNIPVHRKIPNGTLMTRTQCLETIPGINSTNLTGAASWYDAQVFSADEAVIETAYSAALHGATVANYVKATAILKEGNSVIGVHAKDELSGDCFVIHGKLVINAAGPWAKVLLSTLNLKHLKDFDLPLTKSMNIVTRRLFGDYAVGIQSKRQSDSVVGSTKRLYFFTPWKNCTIIGTTHFPYNGNPDKLSTTEEEVQQFITEINEVYPKANLTLDDVHYCYKGLTPSEEVIVGDSSSTNASRSHHSKVIDHSTDGIEGIISIVGVKYTTARLVAEKSVNMACRKLHKPLLSCSTRTQALENSTTKTVDPAELNDEAFKTYCENKIDDTWALHLDDLVLRRMTLAMQGKLSLDKLKICLKVMSKKLNWNQEQQIKEINSLSKSWLSHKLKQDLKLMISSP